MRTVLTSKIDGFDIIDGFGVAAPDPEATKKKLAGIILETAEATALGDKKTEINEIWDLVRAARVAASAQGVTQNEQKVEYEKYKTHMAEIEVKNDDLAPLHKSLETKIEELRVSEAVYFEPKLGEFLESGLAAAIEDLELAYPIPDGKLLALDGILVDDLRGVIYWEKNAEWVATQILQIGVAVPAGGIRQDVLTDIQTEEIKAQIESARVSELSAAEKLNEKAMALQEAAVESERLFNQYTIQNIPDPLGAAQDWLAAETDRIEVKYV